MLKEWTSCYNSKMVWLLFVVVLLTTPLLAISLEIWTHKTNYPRHFSLMLLYQSRKWVVMSLCVSSIDFVSFYDFDIWFLELFRQCGIVGIVPTVVFFVFFHFIVTKYLFNLNTYLVILLWYCILYIWHVTLNKTCKDYDINIY